MSISGQMPIFHCAGHVLMLSYLAVGGKVALMRGFDPLVAMETVQRERLTVFIGLPLMYQAMLDHPRRQGLRSVVASALQLRHGADGRARCSNARSPSSVPNFP